VDAEKLRPIFQLMRVCQLISDKLHLPARWL
jgi:hypothetical protein